MHYLEFSLQYRQYITFACNNDFIVLNNKGGVGRAGASANLFFSMFLCCLHACV